MVGKSLRSFEEGEEDRAPSLKRLGVVPTLATQSKRRLYEVWQSHGIQRNRAIPLLSDGADTRRTLQGEMRPKATPILDGFHLTMQLTG
jgi:predicted deacylase